MNNKLNYYQYQPPVPMFSMAQFGFYDWVGRKSGDFLEWHINNFDKKTPRYQNDPGFKAETDHLIDNINKSRIDPEYNRVKGKQVTLLYGATALGLAAIGAGTYFIRKRKSKNGKQIIERVRR